MGTLTDMAPLLVAAAAGLAARHVHGAHMRALVKKAIRSRESVRTERERYAGLVWL
ncbi:hypothetical protein [Streptomyces sp. cf386]|uniref:hypothetical protein n=1 Tax=Streptomyces sp. cf386 TaxID=1761904 RepID=UPI001C40B26D|nr:hypothetical protein [Streptomyces sp. cf386]